MIIKGNSRLTALVGGICTLRKGIGDYEEVQSTVIFKDVIITDITIWITI